MTRRIDNVKILVENQNILAVSPDTTIRELALQMPTHHSSAAIVLDQKGKLIGIVSENSIVEKAVAKGLDLDKEPVSAVMTKNPVTMSGDTTLGDALGILTQSGLRTIPVIDNNKCIGIVDIRDLYKGINALLDEQHKIDASLIAYAFGESYGAS